MEGICEARCRNKRSAITFMLPCAVATMGGGNEQAAESRVLGV